MGTAVGAYVFAVFAVTWAWLGFTWSFSAHGNDDGLFRVATIVQMVGVVLLVFGLPVGFETAAGGGSPDNTPLVVGHVVVRVPLVALWARAARQDPTHRRVARAHAVIIAVAQVGWVLTAVPPLPGAVAGADGPVDLEQPGDLAALVAVIALVALPGVVEVVGHEVAGYRHTLLGMERS